MIPPRAIRNRPASLPVVIAVALLAGACDDTTSPGEASPRIGVVRIVDSGPILRSLGMHLTRPAPVEVFYEPLGGDGSRIFRIRSDSARFSHQVLLPRLLADTSYRYIARVVGAQAEAHEVRGTFATGPLPQDLREIDFTVEGQATFPLLLFNHEVEDGFRGLIALEPEGNIVWYATEPEISGAATPIPGSHDMVLMKSNGQAMMRVDPWGNIVSSLECCGLPDGWGFHHDLAALDEERVAAIALDRRPVGDTTVAGEAIWIWNTRTGEAEKVWSSWDHFQWETDRGTRSEPDDWLHANALSVGPRGNLVLSMHFLDQVISIAPDFETLEWRLGGVNATVAVSPEDQFSGQHSAFEVSEGRVLLFDNNFEEAFSGGHSRGLELEIHGDTAWKVWEYVADPPVTASIWSGIYPLENGHRVVTFSIPDVVRPPGVTDQFIVDEVDGSGQRVWRLSGPGLTPSFRGVPWPSIAGEVRVEEMPQGDT